MNNQDISAGTAISAISLTAARLSLATAIAFLVLLAALHFMKPELDPSWRVISEYAILAVFIGSVSVMLPPDGSFGPEVSIGWPNRLMVIAYCAWLMTVAWCAIRLRANPRPASTT